MVGWAGENGLSQKGRHDLADQEYLEAQGGEQQFSELTCERNGKSTDLLSQVEVSRSSLREPLGRETKGEAEVSSWVQPHRNQQALGWFRAHMRSCRTENQEPVTRSGYRKEKASSQCLSAKLYR